MPRGRTSAAAPAVAAPVETPPPVADEVDADAIVDGWVADISQPDETTGAPRSADQVVAYYRQFIGEIPEPLRARIQATTCRLLKGKGVADPAAFLGYRVTP